MRTGITITLAQDVPAGEDVDAVEAELLKRLKDLLLDGLTPDEHIVEKVAPKRHPGENGYRLMRDGENQPQYTEVRVSARVASGD